MGGNALHDLNGEFVRNLATTSDDPNWQMYDAARLRDTATANPPIASDSEPRHHELGHLISLAIDDDLVVDFPENGRDDKFVVATEVNNDEKRPPFADPIERLRNSAVELVTPPLR